MRAPYAQRPARLCGADDFRGDGFRADDRTPCHRRQAKAARRPRSAAASCTPATLRTLTACVVAASRRAALLVETDHRRYRALSQAWQQRKRGLVPPGTPLPEQIRRYALEALNPPDRVRLTRAHPSLSTTMPTSSARSLGSIARLDQLGSSASIRDELDGPAPAQRRDDRMIRRGAQHSGRTYDWAASRVAGGGPSVVGASGLAPGAQRSVSARGVSRPSGPVDRAAPRGAR